MVRSIIAILAVGAMVSDAAADTQVWFSTPNVNGNSPGDPGGAPGEDLNLFCETGVGVCEWQIDIIATHIVNLGNWVGYGLDLKTADVGNPKNLSASDAINGATNPFDNLNLPGTAGPGPDILTGTAGNTFNTFGSGTFHLVTFTLSKPKDLVPGSIGIIAAQDNSNPWANECLWCGGEPHEYARIVVTNVPEPDTLALASMCGLYVARRRRRINRV